MTTELRSLVSEAIGFAGLFGIAIALVVALVRRPPKVRRPRYWE